MQKVYSKSRFTFIVAVFLLFSFAVGKAPTKAPNTDYPAALALRLLSSPPEILSEDHLPGWLQKMPNGLPEPLPPPELDPSQQGRTHQVKNLFLLSDILEKKAHGLGNFSSFPPDIELKRVYLLESAIVDTLHKLAESPQLNISDFDRALLNFNLRQTYSLVRNHAHRMATWVHHELDIKLPGGTGLRYPVVSGQLDICDYLLNCRTDKPVTEEQRKKFYEEKLQKFTSSGGNTAEMFQLTTESVSKFKGLERLEYVQRQNGQIWVTPGKAGHVLLAGGSAVKAAGQILTIKNQSGQLTFVVASSGSGSFRPYLFSVDRFRLDLSRSLGYPQSHIILTEEEPLAPLLISLAHKARGTPAEEVEKDLAQVKKERLKFQNFLIKNPALNALKNEVAVPESQSSQKFSTDCSKKLSRIRPPASN